MRVFIMTLLAACFVFVLSYRLMSRAILDARADGAAQVDAGPTVDAGYTMPDPASEPAKSWTEARKFWAYGGWQGIVFVILIISRFVVVRMEPKDEDGDGKPDPVGWRGMTWAIAAAVVAVAGPLVAIAAGVPGANFNAVFLGLMAAVPLLMSNRNPKPTGNPPLVSQ